MSLPTNPAIVEQDVDESISRTISFAHDLNNSTISAVTWTVPAGLTLSASSNTTTTATFRLAAGATPGTYRVTCLVGTVAGETLQTHVMVTVTD